MRAQAKLSQLFSWLFLLVIAFLITYGIVRWVGIDPGEIQVWAVWLGVLWWMVIMVTLPWDLYFKAKELLVDARRSTQQGVAIKIADISYVQRWARIALIGALTLHVCTAAMFAGLAALRVMDHGYITAAAALLLMAFRPAGRAYEYLANRLQNIGQQIQYPKDHVVALKEDLAELQSTVAQQGKVLSLEDESGWAHDVESRLTKLEDGLEKMRQGLVDLRAENEDAHRKLARDAEAAAAQIAVDGKVLNHVRELVRFFKDA